MKIDGSSDFNLKISAFNDVFNAAKEMYKVYTAFITAGFSEEQALYLVGKILGTPLERDK